MNIDEKDYYKIIDHLYLNQLDIDKSFFPKVIGNGQSNPTFLIQDKNAQFKVLRMQPSGDLVRGAHRVDREFLVLRAPERERILLFLSQFFFVTIAQLLEDNFM